MSGRWLWLWLVVVLSTLACAPGELTEMVIEIRASPLVLAQSDSLSLRVLADPEGAGVLVRDDVGLQFIDGFYTLALSPENPANAGRYLVEARAMSGGRTVASASLESGYQQNQTRHVTLLLETGTTIDDDALDEPGDAGLVPAGGAAADGSEPDDAAAPDPSDTGATPTGCDVPTGTYLFTFEKQSDNCAPFTVDTSTITQLYVLDGTGESLLEDADDCLPGTAVLSGDGCELTLRQQCDAPNPYGVSAGDETFIITLRMDDPEFITGTQIADIETFENGAMCRVVMKVTGVPQ